MSLDCPGSKWAAGFSYGPVLTTTELYLLQTDLQLNPILTNSNPAFHLIFHLQTGSTSGFNPEARDRDVPFTAKDEPATLPRVQELIVICESSPWCTIVRNEKGVTLQDVCTTIWKEYTDHYVTDAEFAALPPRLQDALRRTATNNQSSSGQWNMYYTPAQVPNRYKRIDWLRDKVYFDGLLRNDHYTINRLGYKASNVFVMQVASEISMRDVQSGGRAVFVCEVWIRR